MQCPPLIEKEEERLQALAGYGLEPEFRFEYGLSCRLAGSRPLLAVALREVR